MRPSAVADLDMDGVLASLGAAEHHDTAAARASSGW
jgi:hypothetical protein